MPMPMAAPSKTARKRASVACRAWATTPWAWRAATEMASCSASVRSRSSWANPAAMACWSRAERVRRSSWEPSPPQ
jgi:hypothetical protein